MKLDLSYLKNMTAGDKSLMKEMVLIFEEQFDEFSAKMKASLMSSNWKELARLAHKAKPSVAVMGMADIAEELRNLEMLASEGIEPERYGMIIEKYIEACKKASEELTKMLQSD
jgi:HPt (histidine-containing phosphotransfer) domain-containing protein